MLSIFKRNKKSKPTFKEKFEYFQSLLHANDSAHRALSELVEIIAEGKPFSRGAVHSRFDALMSSIRTIIDNFNLFTDNKFAVISQIFHKLSNDYFNMLNSRFICAKNWDCNDNECFNCISAERIECDVPHSIPIDDIDADMEQYLGSKMARLGAIRKHLGLNVPNGFSLTTRFFDELMQYSGLRQQKNRIFYDVDFEDIEQVQKASQETQELFIQLDFPEIFRQIANQAYRATFGDNKVMIAVRSSAVGEDVSGASFAGLHTSLLNQSPENLFEACLEALLSKYSPQSLVYRFVSGLRDEDMPMSVGVIEMIDAVSAGVLFTKDPLHNLDRIIIQASYGLGESVVSGSVQPQEYILDKSQLRNLIAFKPGKQHTKRVSSSRTGSENRPLSEKELSEPCLNDEQLKLLSEYALKIENFFNEPQDIEWAIDPSGTIYILQARPLEIKVSSKRKEAQQINADTLKNNNHVLIDSGDCASRGIAIGKAVIVKNLRDLKNAGRGDIIVARKNMPELASVLHKVAGVITETGSSTGHLSIIARELGTPLLTNAENAISIINTGDLITLYSDIKTVFKGEVEELKDFIYSGAHSLDKYRKSPMFKLWHKIVKMIVKLNLVDFNSPDFRASNCKTIHDIIRFTHEISIREMFSFQNFTKLDGAYLYRLNFDVPIDVRVIDIGNGIKPESKDQASITPADITSMPFSFLLDGMMTPGLKWSGQIALDTKGFTHLVLNNIVDVYRSESELGGSSFAIISDKYMNFFSRFGYHLSRITAYASDELNMNFIMFVFRGGAAEPLRQARRIHAVRLILEHFNFTVQMEADSLTGNLKKISSDKVLSILKELGRMTGAVRNVDVSMVSDRHIDVFVQGFLEGDINPAERFTNAKYFN